MRKTFLLLLAAIMLPLSLGAQLSLEPNQRILGHYTTDDVATVGWGKTFLTGLNTVATDITPDELAAFSGDRIVAFRIGLSESAPISRLFVIPIDGMGNLLNDQMREWPCEASSIGWNVIELPSPYDIDMPDDYSLRIGFDYEQATRNSKPLSVVNVGTIYPSLHRRFGNWVNYGINTSGNLSIQCIVEKSHSSPYILRVDNLTSKWNVKNGDELPFSFATRNLGDGQVLAGQATYNISIDDNVVLSITNPEDLSSNNIIIKGSVSTTGLTEGQHTLTVTAIAVNDMQLTTPASASTSFNTFDFGFSRQMHLVEQFTSTGGLYDCMGTDNVQNLCNIRDDIAWVCIHHNFSDYTDPLYNPIISDSIMYMEGIDGYPEGTFDRAMGISSSDALYAALSTLSADTMSTFLDYLDASPSQATVNINSTFDSKSRKIVVTINGDLVPNFEDIMGKDSKLTVYITEDSIISPQRNQYGLINEYVHNNVLRCALVSVMGVPLNKSGNSYKNTFVETVPTWCNADNMNIVAFISRPLGNSLNDIYVTNANKRKLGECDIPATKRGDVNCDGNVNIADVTALINLLLQGNATGDATADCNSDGNVNISDVTALINFLLSGVW